MTGMAGILELTGAPFAVGPLLRAMTGAPVFTGPDDPDGLPDFQAPGVGLGARHPSPAGAAGLARPGTNEDGGVVVCTGWPLAVPGLGSELRARGHRLRGAGD